MRWACSRPRSSSKLRSGATTSRSASRRTLCACPRSVATTHTVNSARCHRSWCAVSAADTLKRLWRRSFKLFSTWRLSLSDWQAPRCSSHVITPTTTGSTALRRPPGLERASDLLDPVGLEQVADPYIIEVLDPHAALEDLTHFPDVLLEALERRQGPVVHLDAVADHAHPCRSGDHARAHEAAGDRAHLGDLEQLAHLRLAQHDLLLLRCEHPFHRRLHLFHRLVDDAVGADLHLLALGRGARVRVRPDVEADADRVRGLGDQHVPICAPADPPPHTPPLPPAP